MTIDEKLKSTRDSVLISTLLQEQALQRASIVPWDTIIRDIRNALDTERYTEAIAQSSRWISQFPNLPAKIVELRALAYEKTANNACELEDALLLIKINPETTNGYLRAAKIFSIQGKQQKAIDVLNDGFNVCADKSQRKRLQRQLDQATERFERRIDFIAHVPYDILCNILSHFTFVNTPFICTDVCSAWYTKVRGCHIPWQHVELSYQTLEYTNNRLHYILPKIIHHIRHLKIYIPSILASGYLGLIIVGRSLLWSLRSLHINCKDFLYPIFDSVDMIEPLHLALPHISRTLTELEICDIDVTLGRILTLCPNLISLYCKAKCITATSDDYPIHRNTSLTIIRLECQENPIIASDLVPILRHSPRLQSLQVYETIGDLLSIVAEHCTSLVALEMNLWNLAEEGDGFMYIPKKHRKASSKGLQVFTLTKVASIQPLRNLLEKSVDSLNTFSLSNILEGTNGIDDWAPLSTTKFKNLTFMNFELRHSTLTFCRQLPTIIRNCPALRFLQIDHWYPNYMELYVAEDTMPSPETQAMIEAITNLKHLVHLILKFFDIRSESFAPFLEQIGGQLEELELSNCCGITIDTMHQISKMTKLKTLTLDFPEDAMDEDTTEFFSHVSKFSELNTLRVANASLTTEAAHDLIYSKKDISLVTYEVEMSPAVFTLLNECIDFSYFPVNYEEWWLENFA